MSSRIKMSQVAFNVSGSARACELVRKHDFRTLERANKNITNATITRVEFNDFIKWQSSVNNYLRAKYKGLGVQHTRVSSRYITDRCFVELCTFSRYQKRHVFNTLEIISSVITLQRDEADAFIEWYLSKKRGDKFISEVTRDDN